MNKPTKTQYKARNGAMQWKPSIELIMALGHDDCGFCLACGAEVPGVEPDIRQAECPECGAHKVYGGEELALMGLTF